MQPVISEYKFRADIDGPLTFAFVSDLHDSGGGPALEMIKKTGADAVLVGGDCVHKRESREHGLSFLRSCSDLLPTFLSLGNHEFRCGGDIKELIERAGARLLDDSDVRFNGVRIGGLTSGFRGGERKAFSKTPLPDTAFLANFAKKDGFKILLSHHPEYYPDYIKPLALDLTLSGHAHGGQWRIFGRGLYAPGQGVFPEYTSGIYEGRLIVSRGLGNPHLIPRINNRPELVVIKLYPANGKQPGYFK